MDAHRQKKLGQRQCELAKGLEADSRSRTRGLLVAESGAWRSSGDRAVRQRMTQPTGCAGPEYTKLGWNKNSYEIKAGPDHNDLLKFDQVEDSQGAERNYLVVGRENYLTVRDEKISFLDF